VLIIDKLCSAVFEADLGGTSFSAKGPTDLPQTHSAWWNLCLTVQSHLEIIMWADC